MLLYPGPRLWPIAFAAVVSIASKVLFRAPVGTDKKGQTITQHFFNPSNFGITATLLLMPAVGLAPPYMFTEHITGAWNWVLPGIILLFGAIVHAKFTGRFPLVIAWLAGFVLQALIRAEVFGIPFIAPLVPMTSAGFMLFTLFMIPDPATTPLEPRRQVAFGLAVAAAYGLLFVLHIVFGMFIALASVSLIRGAALYSHAAMKRARTRFKEEPALQPLAVSGGD
jgi:Na+-translocating ferredoxin:NAD+ oxidoreductase RnfD subunit